MPILLLITFLFLYTPLATAAVDLGTASDLADRQVLVRQATQGSAKAQYRLGTWYVVGNGVPQNDTEAATWFRKAAEQGHVGTQSSLALMYAAGLGIPRDLIESARWYRKAAEQGDAEAQAVIAALYYYGRGVPQSKVVAYQWATIALANSLLTSEYRSALQGALTELSAELTPAEITKANKLVEQWEERSQ
jgi:TPR repeat protein